MKIQNINNYMNYKGSTKPIKNTEEAVKAKKYDVIEIKGSTHQQDKKLETIKKDVVSQINKEANIEKINKIKESINNKTYSIDVEEIVNKLLK